MTIVRTAEIEKSQSSSSPTPPFAPQRQSEPLNDRNATPTLEQLRFGALQGAAYRDALEKLRDTYAENPRAAMIQVSGWIPRPTIGLPMARTRAKQFAHKMGQVEALLSENQVDQALSLLKECSKDFDATQATIASNQRIGKPKPSDLVAAIARYGTCGEKLSKQLKAAINPTRPDRTLRMLEEINIAQGKPQEHGLEELYKRIAVAHEPLLAATTNDAHKEKKQEDYRHQKAIAKTFNAAVVLYQDKHYALAEVAFSDFAKKYPEHVLAKNAQKAVQSCLQLQAQSMLGSLETLATQSDLLALASGRMEWKEGSDEAYATIKKLEASNPEDAAALYCQLGDLEYALENHTEARKCFLSALDGESTHSAYAQYSLAVLEAETGDKAKALASFTQFSKDHPTDPHIAEVHVRSATIELELGNTKNAVLAYRKALSSELSNSLKPHALHSAGVLELAHGDTSKGTACLQELLKEYPEYSQSKDVRAILSNHHITQCFSKAEELAQDPSTVDKAIEELIALAEEHPQQNAASEALYRASHYAASSQQWGKCETLATRCLSLNDAHPHSNAARELLAQSQFAQAKYQQALEQYRVLLTDSPEDPRAELWKEEVKAVHEHIHAAAFNTVVAAVKAKDGDTAKLQLQEYSEKFPNDPKLDSLWYTLARRYLPEDKNAAKALLENLQHSTDTKVAYASKSALAELAYGANNFREAAKLSTSLMDELAKVDESQASTPLRTRLENLAQQAHHAAATHAHENANHEELDFHIASLRQRFPDAKLTADTIILKANSILTNAQNLQNVKNYPEAQEALINCKSLLSECEKIYLTLDAQRRGETPLEDIRTLLPAVNTRLAFLEQAVQLETLHSAVSAGDNNTIQETARRILDSPDAEIYHDQAALHLGESLLAVKEYQQAEEVLEQLIERTSSIEDPKARLALGSLYLAKAQPETAATKFAEVATCKAAKGGSKELQEEISRCQIEALFGLLECCKVLDAQTDSESVVTQLKNHPLFGKAEETRLETLLK